jgi:hypothetical protein
MLDIVHASLVGDMHKLRPVKVVGYKESMSMTAFHKRILDAGFEQTYVHNTFDVYDCLPHIEFEADKEIERCKSRGQESLFSIIGETVSLKDYYKEVGYDYKTKKLNGLTFRQHIAKAMRSRHEDSHHNQ